MHARERGSGDLEPEPLHEGLELELTTDFGDVRAAVDSKHTGAGWRGVIG